MILIKYLLSALLMTGVDENGWAKVEKVEKNEFIAESDEIDRSIWVAFAKEMGPEKILVSFPEDPEYRYMDREGKEMEVMARGPGAEYRMQVIDRVFETGEELLDYRREALIGAGILGQKADDLEEVAVAELSYWKEGHWVFEKLVSTSHKTYFFQTQAVSLDDSLHEKFIASFDLQEK